MKYLPRIQFLLGAIILSCQPTRKPDLREVIVDCKPQPLPENIAERKAWLKSKEKKISLRHHDRLRILMSNPYGTKIVISAPSLATAESEVSGITLPEQGTVYYIPLVEGNLEYRKAITNDIYLTRIQKTNELTIEPVGFQATLIDGNGSQRKVFTAAGMYGVFVGKIPEESDMTYLDNFCQVNIAYKPE